MDDLTQATRLTEQETPSDFKTRVSQLHNLSVLLSIRFEQRGNLEDLKLGIGSVKEAIAMTPAGHRYLLNLQRGLGNLLA